MASVKNQAVTGRSRLQQWRLDNSLTLAEVADITGTSVAMVSRVERGERVMAPMHQVRFARRLGVRIADLFEVQALDLEANDAA